MLYCQVAATSRRPCENDDVWLPYFVPTNYIPVDAMSEDLKHILQGRVAYLWYEEVGI